VSRPLAIVAVLAAVAACAGTEPAKREPAKRDNEMPDERQPRRYAVVYHRPGPKWQAGTPFNEQPGVMEHVRYMGGLVAQDKAVMGGPFLDAGGGGMFVLDVEPETARELAEADPAVRDGLLRVEVRPWLVLMSR